MKKLLLLFAFVFATHFVAAQQTNLPAPAPEADNSIYALGGLEMKPEFPGGMKEFYNYIGKEYKVPNVKGLQGKIIVTFVIEKDGSLTDIKVLREIGHGTGKEAVRVLKDCPKWIPGEQNGKKVRAQYTLPITIQPQ